MVQLFITIVIYLTKFTKRYTNDYKYAWPDYTQTFLHRY